MWHLLNRRQVRQWPRWDPHGIPNGPRVNSPAAPARTALFSKTAASANGLAAHVHAFERGSAHIERHLRFRDYLIAHPQLAEEYAALKRSLGDASGVLVIDYAELKAPFVQRIEALAFAEGSARDVSEPGG